MSAMQESLQVFSDHLLAVSTLLEQQKYAVSQVEQEVFDILDQAAQAFAVQKDESSNALRQTINQVFRDLTDGIRRWKTEMASRSEVRSRLEDMGTGLIVVVFGRTNAGKSTLGNFLRGKQLREAAFDNAWKRSEFAPGPITVIEQGEDAETVSDAEWFAEGGVETTREAQMFRLPGLLWLDTPGFGSVNDGTLGALARKYVRRADLVVYLDDSDNPGLANITARLVEILAEGRCTLVAINHSDKQDYVRDADGKRLKGPDGKVLRKRIAKSAEDRAAQEDYLIGILRQMLPNQPVDAISISMLLARMGVENNDEELFRASNVEALLSRIMALIPDNEAVTRLKYRDAIQNCMALVDMVSGRAEASAEECCLSALEAHLSRLDKKIRKADQDFDVENEVRAISAPILLRARDMLRGVLQTAQDTPGQQEKRVDLSAIVEDVRKAALQGVDDKARTLLRDLWIESGTAIQRSFPAMETAVIKKKTERHTYEVMETESYARSPEGLWEHVRSWFGKSYLGRRKVYRQREQIIDLGYNIEEVFAEQYRLLETACLDYVRGEMAFLREECLVRGARVVNEHREVLKKAEKQLEDIRQRLERELGQSSNTGAVTC